MPLKTLLNRRNGSGRGGRRESSCLGRDNQHGREGGSLHSTSDDRLEMTQSSS